ncbi:4'-phosphopantetheinyl transferase family protein [Kribbella sp. NPDC050124]|uniref:4'-phosphopantetheinyl transferase family protein n=1 Tax=Kribbella sp. NPDC050124 TaxID=3364114 RepID=UPI0037AC3182
MDDSVHVWLAPAGNSSAAHTLLLDLAASLLGGTPSLHHAPSGQPRIAGLAVSLSRSHSWIAAAASFAAPIGIDIEDIHPREVNALANRWFTPTELHWMSRQPDTMRAFLRLWTAKEAVTKALGHPLSPEALHRPMPLPTGPLPTTPTLAVQHLPNTPNAVLAVAAPTSTPEIHLTEYHGPRPLNPSVIARDN